MLEWLDSESLEQRFFYQILKHLFVFEVLDTYILLMVDSYWLTKKSLNLLYIYACRFGEPIQPYKRIDIIFNFFINTIEVVELVSSILCKE